MEKNIEFSVQFSITFVELCLDTMIKVAFVPERFGCEYRQEKRFFPDFSDNRVFDAMIENLVVSNESSFARPKFLIENVMEENKPVTF